MRNSKPIQLLCVLVWVLCWTSTGFGQQLILQGGGSTPKELDELISEIAKEHKHAVIIPTAIHPSNLPYEQDHSKSEVVSLWKGLGFEKVTLLHSWSVDESDTSHFVKPLEGNPFVWISGGNQNRLAAVYPNTKTEQRLRDLSRGGGWVAGSSAGAAIQSRIMIGGGRTEPELNRGIDLLPHAIVDQHFSERNRKARLVKAVEQFPFRYGVGIDESTCLIVRDRNAEVIGRGTVTLITIESGRTVEVVKKPGEKFELPFPAMDANKRLKGFAEVSQRRGGWETFVKEGAIAAELFRQRYAADSEDGREPRIKTLARLFKQFASQSNAKDAEIGDFYLEQGFEGYAWPIDAYRAYGQFSGQWFGRWTDSDVDHQWGPVVECVPPIKVVDAKQGVDLSVIAFQYAWIGDGYGVNLVTRRDSGEDPRYFLLGYVEHLKDGDFDQVTSRRPHVGVPKLEIAGGENFISPGITVNYKLANGQLIWVTEKELFVEQAHGTGKADNYSILGFHYSSDDNNLAAKKAFLARYGRKAQKREPFLGWDVDLKVQVKAK